MNRIRPTMLEKQVSTAVKRAFTTVVSSNRDQRFYAFGLFTDDSLQFLHPIANTEEALNATVRRYRAEVDPKYGGASTHASMRWSYGDWAYFPDVDEEAFRDINVALSQNFEQMMEDDTFDGDLDALWDAILNGFMQVESQGFFAAHVPRSQITLLLAGDVPEDLVCDWVTRLNPIDVARRYIDWNPDLPE
jgi:hypothetical protein